ncbi:MAG: hypothetical protein LBI72_14045 [Flavobacteriaceae bacterium]|jgi:hypothetical protein|nr:hypothetical protein [Flavobacteriaceae bacterium]
MNIASKDFTPLYATTNATITLLLRLAFVLFSLLFIVPLYLAPIGLFLEEIYTTQFGIFYALYAITLTYLLYKFVKYIQKSNTKSVSTISVDREGLHYTFLDKTTEDILFKDLSSYKQLYTPDVTSYTKGRSRHK